MWRIWRRTTSPAPQGCGACGACGAGNLVPPGLAALARHLPSNARRHVRGVSYCSSAFLGWGWPHAGATATAQSSIHYSPGWLMVRLEMLFQSSRSIGFEWRGCFRCGTLVVHIAPRKCDATTTGAECVREC
eukprot:687297-Alexandrium_andersonii.AAC.1